MGFAQLNWISPRPWRDGTLPPHTKLGKLRTILSRTAFDRMWPVGSSKESVLKFLLKSFLFFLREINIPIGHMSSLQLQLYQYTPRVRCQRYGYVPDLAACKKVLQLVPASHNQEVFGPKGEVGVDVGLPATYDDGKLEPSDWYCPEGVLT